MSGPQQYGGCPLMGNDAEWRAGHARPLQGGQDLYFHAGQDFVLNTRDVIGVFDLDTAGASRRTEEYFRHVESEGAVVDLCAPGTLPKSFLVTDFPDETIYISQLSPAALKKRAEKLEF